MGIKITSRGSFGKTEAWLNSLKSEKVFADLTRFGDIGVAALASATPTDSGATASSWTYEIVQKSGYFSIRWLNTNMENGFPVAVMLQYGHGTGTGGYVQGRDYINPAIQPIFDQMIDAFWKGVTK